MTGAKFSVTREGRLPSTPHSKLHLLTALFFSMRIVDTASCDWRHALHRLIGMLNWKTAGEKSKHCLPEIRHTRSRNICVISNPWQVPGNICEERSTDY